MSSIKLKNFGNDRLFESFEDVKETLSKDYRGCHVSIIFTNKKKFHVPLFVSISSEGKIFKSYGDQAEVDFSKLELSLAIEDTAD